MRGTVAEQVLYRKYRSADFGDVVGQDHVVQTLTNAVASGRVAHAYLFTGPRGVGKTSVARLLARALNCTGETEIKPCNACASCTAAINTSLDVIEIDAASNRRIEEIRDLRDKINLAPTMGRYKVYIIDEVHMLTTEAFNALLKTLEEPPAHAILILATTEVHKLPETIISRTQRFSFNPIAPSDIISRLKHIAGLEKITVDDQSLDLIATAARGGFRDAISLLDQVASSGASPITTDLVRLHLGWSDPGLVDNLIIAVVEGRPGDVLAGVDALIQSGAQAGQLAQELVRAWRSAMVANASSNTAKSTDGLARLASSWSLVRLAGGIEALVAVGRSSWPEVSLEACLVTLACPEEPAASPKSGSNSTPEPMGAISDKAATARAEDPAPTPSRPKPEPAQAAKADPSSAAKPSPAPRDLWPKALLVIKGRHNNLCAIVSSCQFKLEGDQATLVSKFNFHRDLINQANNRQIIEQALDKVYGRPITVKAQTAAATATKTRATNPTAELVSSALEILGGEVVDGEN